MSTPENYFCKDGYAINAEAKTLNVLDSDQYWTKERIELSGSYQYYVYELASTIASQKGVVSALDLGCGTGVKTKAFISDKVRDVVLVDQESSKSLVQSILPGSKFIGADLEACEIDVASEFGLIICADVIEHLFNPMPCLQFVRKHLAPSGVALFSTPERDVLRGKDCMVSPHGSHVREWNGEEFKELLRFSGFEVEMHLTFPIERLSRIENLSRVMFNRLLKLPKWNGCQVAVCTRGAGK